MKDRPRVLLADDHKIVLEGLRSLLEPECEVIGTVEDGLALLAAAEQLHPDVIVLDISMPLLSGIEAAQRLRNTGAGAKIVFLTMHADATYAARALEAGASGFVLKHSAASELVGAIREALRGRVHVTPMVAKEVLHSVKDGSPRRRQVARTLTTRQREVLQMVAEGRSARHIGSVLRISSRTVEFHKYRMMENLGLRTNAELVRYANEHGIASV